SRPPHLAAVEWHYSLGVCALPQVSWHHLPPSPRHKSTKALSFDYEASQPATSPPGQASPQKGSSLCIRRFFQRELYLLSNRSTYRQQNYGSRAVFQERCC